MQALTRILLLGLIAAVSSGCCGIAQWACAIEPPASPSPYTRMSPAETVSYLGDAFENGRVRDIYETLHQDWLDHMRAQGASVTAGDFQTLYDYYEDDFRADAELLARGELSALRYNADRSQAQITVTGSGGGFITLLMQNQPTYEIHLDDDVLIGTLPAVARSVRVEDADLVVTQRLGLADLAGIDATEITRVVLTDSWQLRGIIEAQDIRFITRIEEEMGTAGR